MNRRETGVMGEKIACNFLRNNGYQILENNYRCKAGEIDVVCRQRDMLVFVEVRTKKSVKFGTPEESITTTKMRHLHAAAIHYALNHDGLPQTWRIDLVAIELNAIGKCCRVELIENAVEDI